MKKYFIFLPLITACSNGVGTSNMGQTLSILSLSQSLNSQTVNGDGDSHQRQKKDIEKSEATTEMMKLIQNMIKLIQHPEAMNSVLNNTIKTMLKNHKNIDLWYAILSAYHQAHVQYDKIDKSNIRDILPTITTASVSTRLTQDVTNIRLEVVTHGQIVEEIIRKLASKNVNITSKKDPNNYILFDGLSRLINVQTQPIKECDKKYIDNVTFFIRTYFNFNQFINDLYDSVNANNTNNSKYLPLAKLFREARKRNARTNGMFSELYQYEAIAIDFGSVHLNV